MANQKVEFRKIREFGEILGDTFVFIKSNLKALITSFLGICFLFMVAHAIFNFVYQTRSFGIFDRFREGYVRDDYSGIRNLFTIQYLMTVLFAWLSHIAMNVTLASYVKVYVEQDGITPRFAQVWDVFRRNFLRVLIFSLPVFLLIAVGFVFCIIPGVYLLIVLLPLQMILVIEDVGLDEAFNRCFRIIRENFWVSFAIYLVSWLIYAFSAGIIGLMIGFVFGIVTFLSTGKIGPAAGVLSSVGNLFAAVFYIIFYISVALNYFNLAERADGTGILRKIENIGSSGEHPDQDEKLLE
jgi:hypothetical protein